MVIGAAVLLAGAAALGAAPKGESAGFATTGELLLPQALTHALDLRWWEDGELLVAADTAGTVRLSLGEPPRESPFWPGGAAGKLRSHYRLALDAERVVVAAPLHAMLQGARTGGEILPGPKFEFVEDLDLHGSRLAVLGTRRDGDGEVERGIAWETRLDAPGPPPRPLVLSATTRNSLGACGAFEIGAVRYLADGSLVVVPGTEPDVYLFAPDGTLRRTWQSDPLGIDSGCRLSQEEIEHLGREEPARWRWLAQRRTVDEILPLSGGAFGLVVRDATGADGTRWHLLRLSPDGSVRRVDLPLRSPHPEAFLRGDVRGDDVAFLIGRRWSREQPLDAPPRLVLGRFGVAGQ